MKNASIPIVQQLNLSISLTYALHSMDFNTKLKLFSNLIASDFGKFATAMMMIMMIGG